MPFFVEDFRWTSQNYASMRGKSVEMQRWWLLAEPIREILGQGPQLKELGASSLLTIEAAGSAAGEKGLEKDKVLGVQAGWRLRLRRHEVSFSSKFQFKFLAAL